MNKSFKYRIYPTEKQKKKIENHFGCCRFVWNYFLAENNKMYLQNKEKDEEDRIKGLTNYYGMCKRLTQLKKEKEWLYNSASESLQHVLKSLDSTYKNFFAKRAKFPKFKSKKNDKSYYIHQNISVGKKNIYFPKFQEGVKIVLDKNYEGKILSATISKTNTDKYFVSLNCEVNELQKLEPRDDMIGIDLGLKFFAVLSTGEKIDNPKFMRKQENRLKFYQRKYSKYKGKRTLKRLRLIHEKISNQRNDFLHKFSTRMIRENQAIVLEDLSVKNMIQNHKLAKFIGDVCWSRFSGMLEYKASWYGREILKIDRFYPSSKCCFVCGFIKQGLKLSEREWICSSCKTLLDRDVNAAINIVVQGSKCGRDYRVKRCELPCRKAE